MLADLNRLQQDHDALSEWDCDARGFEWLSGDDKEQSVISFLRRSENESVAVVLNFTPVPREGYRIPVAMPGVYREIFNSDAGLYGGSDVVNRGDLHTEAVPLERQGTQPAIHPAAVERRGTALSVLMLKRRRGVPDFPVIGADGPV